MEDKYASNHDGPKSKKFNGRNVADNIMKGVIVLIMAVIFVMIADQVITTPFISAEIEGEFFHGSIFGTTIITIVGPGGLWDFAVRAAPHLGSDSPHRIGPE